MERLFKAKWYCLQRSSMCRNDSTYDRRRQQLWLARHHLHAVLERRMNDMSTLPVQSLGLEGSIMGGDYGSAVHLTCQN